MTAARYLVVALRGAAGHSALARTQAQALLDKALHAGSGIRHYDLGSAIVAVSGLPPVELRGSGLVIGRLFDRATMRPASHLEAMPGSGARHLVERCWGGWVALLRGADGALTITRAPLGDLPCYRIETADFIIFASDLDLLRATGLWRASIDWQQVRLLLATGEFRRFDTCLAGVGELPGGHTVPLAQPVAAATMLWSPWMFVGADQRISGRDEAAAAVRGAVLQSVRALASGFEKALLLLSGGLDSSILAAALRQTTSDVGALNLVTRDAAGDERHHARRVAGWHSIPLAEMRREVDRIDIHASPADGLPRPSVRLFRQESFRLAALAADQAGATAIVDGSGGDNVFCSLKSSAPAADRLLTSGPGTGFLDTVREISSHAPASMRQVAVDAVRRAWLGKPALRPHLDLSLLSSDACEGIPRENIHPWLRCPQGALPGSAGHIRLITIGQGHIESLDPRQGRPTVSPLLSQPVVETCLRVPSWLWLENGRNRAIARRAFADMLPLDIVTRRSKGSPNSFAAEIFETHRRGIRDMLLGGLLVSERIIDRDALIHVLGDPRPLMSETFQRVLHFVDCEAWARSWARPWSRS
ncbi:asparagine synthase-related protein [Novosphingobium resinovorum]|uniref:asparagine synthase-related protein n=1 Tax=Novosphingobium resinovorum TaxID=158500 RepID=UPI0012E9F82F|nr:asparagine synthase-related protein [Novosphingobium resinovorum]